VPPIQKLHPALHRGRQLALAGGRQLLLSRQGMWDKGSALHCAAMALDVRGYARPAAHFRNRPSRIACMADAAGTDQPHLRSQCRCAGCADLRLRRRTPELLCPGLAAGWPIIVWVANRPTGRRHAAGAVGPESSTPSRRLCCRSVRLPSANTGRVQCAAEVPTVTCLVYHGQGELPAHLDAAVSIRLPQNADAT